MQNYLVFQPMYQYFKRVISIGSGNYIYFWESKRLSNENMTVPTTSDYNLNAQLDYLGTSEFKASCLKQDKITYTHRKLVNIYTVYEISSNNNNNSNYPTLKIVYLMVLVWLKCLYW